MLYGDITVLYCENHMEGIHTHTHTHTLTLMANKMHFVMLNRAVRIFITTCIGLNHPILYQVMCMNTPFQLQTNKYTGCTYNATRVATLP